jgi:glycosyltransferase involved in cell wall biosynthesis
LGLKKFSVALLISTYNWPEALRLVLESVRRQAILPDEVLVADDGSGEETAGLIRHFQQHFPVPIRHFWQEDAGFRKTRIMNTAVAATNCDYIVQIDGDIVLHPSFVADHIAVAEKGVYIKGSRVLLSEAKTAQLLRAERLVSVSPFSTGIGNLFNAIRLPAFAPFFIRKRKRSHDLRGCNCAFWKADFMAVNGYNNDLSGWGHEDIELAARFVNAGLWQKRIKMLAVCYHLYHPINSRSNEDENFRIYEMVVQTGVTSCINGVKA